MFYPIYVDDNTKKIVKTGPYLLQDEEPFFDLIDGLRPVWPVNNPGKQDGLWDEEKWIDGHHVIDILDPQLPITRIRLLKRIVPIAHFGQNVQ